MSARSRILLGIVAVLVFGPSASSAAEPLDEARALYAAASFEDALALLNRLEGEQGVGPDAMQYKALCLMALGRTREAETVTESLVSRSPNFQPPQDLPPRFVVLLTDTRKRLLPTIARRLYSEARDQFHAKNYAPALKQFEQVLALAGDPVWKDSTDAADLRSLAGGFIDLAKVAVSPPVAAAPVVSTGASAVPTTGSAATAASAAGARTAAPPPRNAPAASTRRPAPAPESAPAVNPASASAATAGNPVVEPPVAIRQTMPRWSPPDPFSATQEYRGAIKVRIDATGKVIGASMERPTHPSYDAQLLRAAREWLYQPARRNGQPVDSEKLVDILLRSN